MAKAWGLKQQTLDRYVKGTHLPDYRTAMLMAQEAGVAFAIPALAAGVENTTKNSTTNQWSGREDSNLRLLRPERSTLPG